MIIYPSKDFPNQSTIARMAGNIAAGLHGYFLQIDQPSTKSEGDLARSAVDISLAICEDIQKRRIMEQVGAESASRRLIEAAPALLSALDHICWIIRHSPDPQTLAGKLNSGVLDNAHAALALARGE